MFKAIFTVGSLLLPCIVVAKGIGVTASSNDVVDAQLFSVDLNLNRVVYYHGSLGENVAVKNNQAYPMLVQSMVFDEDKKSPAPFITTPPLFRLDGSQTSRIRIVRTGGEFPQDREKLQWLCVKGIPPQSEDKWAEGTITKNSSFTVQFSVNNCIKVFVRPDTIKGHPEDFADKVTWSKKGTTVLEANNPTPFYLNIKESNIGGRSIKSPNYIPPFGKQSFSIPGSSVGKIQWRIVTDYGGDSKIYQSEGK